MRDLIDRQAVIDALDVLRQEHRYKIPGKRETYSQYCEAWQDALDRAEGAIGSLPSAQPNVHDFQKDADTISRQAATYALRKMQTYKLFSGDDMLLIDQAGAMTELMLLPSAQPEPKRGKWLECDVFDEHNITEWQSAKCSVCGHYHTTPYLYYFTRYSFCPHCGAKMEGVQNERFD